MKTSRNESKLIFDHLNGKTKMRPYVWIDLAGAVFEGTTKIGKVNIATLIRTAETVRTELAVWKLEKEVPPTGIVVHTWSNKYLKAKKLEHMIQQRVRKGRVQNLKNKH